MKETMRLIGIKLSTWPIRLKDGSLIQIASNQYGVAALDNIRIMCGSEEEPLLQPPYMADLYLFLIGGGYVMGFRFFNEKAELVDNLIPYDAMFGDFNIIEGDSWDGPAYSSLTVVSSKDTLKHFATVISDSQSGYYSMHYYPAKYFCTGNWKVFLPDVYQTNYGMYRSFTGTVPGFWGLLPFEVSPHTDDITDLQTAGYAAGSRYYYNPVADGWVEQGEQLYGTMPYKYAGGRRPYYYDADDNIVSYNEEIWSEYADGVGITYSIRYKDAYGIDQIHELGKWQTEGYQWLVTLGNLKTIRLSYGDTDNITGYFGDAFEFIHRTYPHSGARIEHIIETFDNINGDEQYACIISERFSDEDGNDPYSEHVNYYYLYRYFYYKWKLKYKTKHAEGEVTLSDYSAYSNEHSTLEPGVAWSCDASSSGNSGTYLIGHSVYLYGKYILYAYTELASSGQVYYDPGHPWLWPFQVCGEYGISYVPSGRVIGIFDTEKQMHKTFRYTVLSGLSPALLITSGVPESGFITSGYFAVAAMNPAGRSELSNLVTCYYPPEGCSITLSWNAIAGATHYTIYKFRSLTDATGTAIHTTTATSITLTGTSTFLNNCEINTCFPGANYLLNAIGVFDYAGSVSGGGGEEEGGGEGEGGGL